MFIFVLSELNQAGDSGLILMLPAPRDIWSNLTDLTLALRKSLQRQHGVRCCHGVWCHDGGHIPENPGHEVRSSSGLEYVERASNRRNINFQRLDLVIKHLHSSVYL